jgi:hypothetical protein
MPSLLDVLTGKDFEAVDRSVLMVDEHSGEVAIFKRMLNDEMLTTETLSHGVLP